MTDPHGVPKVHTKPSTRTTTTGPYSPLQLSTAYGVNSSAACTATGPTGPTVAIVDAYAYANAASDLVTYREEWGLPLCPTTASNPSAVDLTDCFFTKYNEYGSTTSLPTEDDGWDLEQALDIQTVSAICPCCKIALFEANSSSFADLGTAVQSAWAMGPSAISNSYGGSEWGDGTATANSTYYAPANSTQAVSTVITASSGDSGYGAQFPATSPNIVAVGGTTLTLNSSNDTRYSETAWSRGGSGCSAVFSAPKWEPYASIDCAGKRLEVDVSADANPSTGVYVYVNGSGYAGWYEVGGTSLASPVIATIYALVNKQPTLQACVSSAVSYSPFACQLYTNYTSSNYLYDITSGSNGRCNGSLLCNARVGYDGPTGLGAPNGFAAPF